jgi:hypothetical protein
MFVGLGLLPGAVEGQQRENAVARYLRVRQYFITSARQTAQAHARAMASLGLQEDAGAWTYKDEEGITSAAWSDTGKLASVSYYPTSRQVVAGSVIALLAGKATEGRSPGSLEVTVGSDTPAEGLGLPATRDVLSIGVIEGEWQATSCTFRWK